MNANAMVLALGAMGALAGSPPEIVFCDECPDLAIGRVDGAPLCLSCMLARLGQAEARQGDPC